MTIRINDGFVEYEYKLDNKDLSIDDVAMSIKGKYSELQEGVVRRSASQEYGIEGVLKGKRLI